MAMAMAMAVPAVVSVARAGGLAAGAAQASTPSIFAAQQGADRPAPEARRPHAGIDDLHAFCIVGVQGSGQPCRAVGRLDPPGNVPILRIRPTPGRSSAQGLFRGRNADPPTVKGRDSSHPGWASAGSNGSRDSRKIIGMTKRNAFATTPKMSRLRRAALALALPVVVIAAVAACDDTAAPKAAPTTQPTPSISASSPAGPTPANSNPTAGQHMITNNGHRLAFYVTSGHAPAIVLDSGGGEDHTQWKDIVPQLSKATGSEIITYDRAGLGNSDEVKKPWDGQAAASDLQAGLRDLGVTHNVVLVSHSQAGEVATYFVRANPGVVTGEVLVDANVPQFFTDTEIKRLVAVTTPQIEALKKQPSTKANRQLIATSENFGPTHQAYHKISWPDNVPVTYLASEKTPFDGSPQDAQSWRDAAAAFVKAGPGRTLITAQGSSHEIPHDKPQIVVDEIEKMVTAHS
jgi:pimeloyl-ACP methyl ester carboxylesterase